MLKMEITVWEMYNRDKKEFAFNHISDGYNEDLIKPDSNIPKQKKNWSKAEWKKQRALLVNGKVIRVDNG